MSEMRNELLLIKDLVKAKTDDDKNFTLKWLLERFEIDIKTQLKDLKDKQEELESNLKTLEYVKQNISD